MPTPATTPDPTTFFADTRSFLKRLKRNNSRDWFLENKAGYENRVKDPARRFAAQLQQLLSTELGHPVQAKIFRINRDMRFAKDRAPYNTHLHMSFATRIVGGKPAGAGFFFGLETDRVIVGVGRFLLEKTALQTFQKSVDDPQAGAALVKILAGLQKKGATLADPELKRVPRGYDAEHKRADLLRRKSLTLWRDIPYAKTLSARDPAKFCMRELKGFMPLYLWLDDNAAQ